MMTVQIFWDFVHWMLVPFLSGIVWYILRAEHRLEGCIETLDRKLSGDFIRISAGQTQEISGVRTQTANLQLDIVRNYARADQLDRALDRISASLDKIEQKIENLRGVRHTPAKPQ